MTTEGTLADPPGVSSCVICEGRDPNCTEHSFPDNPYPDDYPFLPLGAGRGGYAKDASHDVEPRTPEGARKRSKLRCRS